MIHSFLEFMRAQIEYVITLLGYPGVFLVMLAENLFPPIPSEFVMPFAGFLAGRGAFSLWTAIAAGTAGSVAGALALYGVGRWAGEPAIRLFVRRYSRILLFGERELDQSIVAFARYGYVAVLAGRVVPLVRSLVSIPAGMSHMPLVPFLALTTLGSLVWTTALALAGYALGEHWDRVLVLTKTYERVVLAAIAAVLVALVVRLIRRRTGRAGPDATAPTLTRGGE